jgi:hypothetical protein
MLPTLPKKLHKKEASFTLQFRKWLLSQSRFYSSAFELKQTDKDYISFSAVKDHQLAGLLAVQSNNGMLYKLPDDSRGSKPFDLFFMRNDEAYIVIKYPHYFVLISVDIFIEEKKQSKRPSLTSHRAKELSTICVEL